MNKLKKTLTIVFIILFLLGTYSKNVLASNNENLYGKLEYSEDFKKWQELPEEEKNKVLIPRIYDIEHSNNSSANILYKARLLGASINQKYSLKDVIPNNLTIRNQKHTGSCWTFAALSSLETNLAISNYKNGTNTSKVYDYSERHMEYANSKTFANNVENKYGYNRKPGSGGYFLFAESYLTNGLGAVNETEMPFEDNENIINISEIQNKTVSSQVYDTIHFEDYGKKTGEEKTKIMNEIKQHIQNYGSVSAGIHGAFVSSMGSECYNNTTGAKYCNNQTSHLPDHNVSIIGWDDNYSIDNFVEGSKPTSNGAWIIRNSWGEKAEYTLLELKEEIFNKNKSACISRGWNSAGEIPNEVVESFGYTINGDKAYIKIGDNGIMYVSYEDCNISKTVYGIIKATDTVNYENIYQYNEFFPVGSVALYNSKIFICNVFDKKTTGQEYLTQVSLYALETNKCKVYVNPNGAGKTKNDLQEVKLRAGDAETINAGYHTLEFANPVEIKGNKFAVVIEIEAVGQSQVAVPLEIKYDENEAFNSINVETGKCFIGSTDNNNEYKWDDLGKLSEINSNLKNGDSTIKAFTVSGLQDGSLKNIEITTPPTKTKYFEGENFDKTGMVVKANYNSKTNSSVILEEGSYTITNGTNLKADQTSVTISYENKSAEQPITVEKNSVTELKIKTPPTKTEYKEGQNFDKTGMVIEATFQNGSKREITDYTIENGSNLKANQTNVKISYGEKSVEQPITVTPNPLMEIKITKAPNKTKYKVGENFDKTGMVITGIYQDESTNEIINYTIENGTNLSKDQTSVTIKYEGKTVEQPITVEENAQNSNFDNAQCNISNVKYYTFTDTSKKAYLVMDVVIDKILKNNVNDSYEYYWYLSSNKNESNIENWTKVSEYSSSDDKIKFEINSKDIKNSDINSNDLYIYIKEVAIKGENKATLVSKPMNINSEVTIETYRDGAQVTNSNSGNETSNNGGDNTRSTTRLPNTGFRNILIILLFIAIAGIVFFIKYKNLHKYIK